MGVICLDAILLHIYIYIFRVPASPLEKGLDIGAYDDDCQSYTAFRFLFGFVH